MAFSPYATLFPHVARYPTCHNIILDEAPLCNDIIIFLLITQIRGYPWQVVIKSQVDEHYQGFSLPTISKLCLVYSVLLLYIVPRLSHSTPVFVAYSVNWHPKSDKRWGGKA